MLIKSSKPRPSVRSIIICCFIFLLLFAATGCGGKKRVPPEKLPKGTLAYTVTPYNDEFKFASIFLYEAIRQRKIADMHNELVLRFDMKKGNPKELEKLLANTVRAYRRAARAAYMANDVAIGLKYIEKMPGYSPYKKLKNRKTAFLVPRRLMDSLFPAAYAGTPYIVRKEMDYRTGNIKNYYSNGTSNIVYGEKQLYPPKGRTVEDKQKYEAYKNEKAKETKKDKEIQTAVAKDIAKVRKQAEAKAKKEIQQLNQAAANKNKAEKLQAWAKQQYSGSWAAPKESSDLIVKHGAKEIVELYDSFPEGDALRGLANALHIKGKTDYETYQKAYDVYRRSKEVTGFVGTKDKKTIEKEADNAYRAVYVTAAAGKTAEAGLAAAAFKATGGLLGAADLGAKTADAVTWGYQAYNVLTTGEEDEQIKEAQKKTGYATALTGVASVIKSTPDWGKGIKNSYDAYKGSHNALEGTVNGTKELVRTIGANAATYDKVAATGLAFGMPDTLEDVGKDVKEMAKPSEKELREGFQDKVGASIEIQDDGTAEVYTTVTNDKDPQKMEKLKAVTGLTEDEIKEEEKALNQLPEDVPTREIEKKIKSYDIEEDHWLDPPAPKEAKDSGISGDVSGTVSGKKAGEASGVKDTDKKSDSGEVSGKEDKQADSGQDSGEVSGKTDEDAPYAIHKVIGATWTNKFQVEGKTYTQTAKVVRAGKGIAITGTDGAGGKMSIRVTEYDPQTGKGRGENTDGSGRGSFQITGKPGKMRLSFSD